MVEREKIRDGIISNPQAILDIHSHCGYGHYNVIKRRYPSSQSVIDLASKTKINGVEYVVSFPFPGSSYFFNIAESLKGNPHVLDPIEDFPYYFANRQLFFETSLFGDGRILPFANIYPKHKEQEQVDYLKQSAQEGILFGLKFHTLATQYSALALIDSPFMEFAQKYSLPVIIHSGLDTLSHPKNIIQLAEHYPKIRFCMAHAAKFEENMFDYITKNKIKNLFIDTSPFISLTKAALSEMKKGIGEKKLDLPYDEPKLALLKLCQLFPDLIVWGTDEPWTTVTDDSKNDILVKTTYKDEADLLHSLPEEIKRKIAYENSILFLFGK